MVKRQLIIFIATLFFVLNTKTAIAQTLTFDKAYQDYLYTRTVYEQSFKDFEASKNAYLGNPTLSLKDEAKQKTLVMLRNRDQLMATYLTSIRTKISEFTSLDSDIKQSILGKIDTEISWYINHKSNYKDDDQSETLFSKSDEAKTQYENNTTELIREALFDITLGEQQTLRLSQEEVYKNLKDIINVRVGEGILTLTPFNNWFNDIDRTIQTLKDNESKAKLEIQKMYTSSNPSKAYESALGIFTTSIGQLAQFNQFLTEVLAYIKNQE